MVFLKILPFFAGLLQGTSAPVNIPGSSLSNFSPSNHSNMFSVTDPFSHMNSGSAPKITNSFPHSDNLFFQQHLISPGLGDTLSISPELRYTTRTTFQPVIFFHEIFEIFFVPEYLKSIQLEMK